MGQLICSRNLQNVAKLGQNVWAGPKELARMIITLKCVAKLKLRITVSLNLQKCNLNSVSLGFESEGLDPNFWSKSGRIRCPNSMKYSKHGQSGRGSRNQQKVGQHPPRGGGGETLIGIALIVTHKILTKRYCLLVLFSKKHKISITLRRASWGEEILTKPGQNWPGLAIHQPSTCTFY